jgi:hypothetical protein
MANQKLTQLTAVTSASTDDLLYLVDDPSGTPSSVKITFGNVQASLTAVGKVAVTQPATAATLALSNGSTFTLTGGHATTLTTTGSTSVTLPTSGTLMGNPMTTGGDIIYGGASGVATRLANGSAGQVLTSAGTTLPPTWSAAATGTVTTVSVVTANGVSGSVATATTTPAITLTLGAITPTTVNGLTISSSSAGVLTIANGSTLATSGANGITLTSSGATNVTLPTTGTLATLAGSEELDNKTLDSSVGKGTWTASGTWTLPAWTMGGAVQMAENVSIILDAALSATGTYCGITEAGTAGATLAFGELVYLAAADSRWELVDADADATSGAVKIGICVLAAAADGSPTTILLYGKVRADSLFPTLTVGAPVYASTTPGAIQTAQPSGTDDVIRIIGYGNTGDELFFKPDDTYVIHV